METATTDAINLADVPLALKANYGSTPPYAVIYVAVLDGVVPATKLRGRWYVQETDLPKIAAHFGLTD